MIHFFPDLPPRTQSTAEKTKNVSISHSFGKANIRLNVSANLGVLSGENG